MSKSQGKSLAQIRAEAKAEAQKEIKEMEARASKIETRPDNVIDHPESTAMKPTITGRKGKKRTFIMPDVKSKPAKVKKERKEAQPKRATEEMILAKYKHAIKGTLKFDAEMNKQSIEAKLQCGHKARIFTSDLFQVKRCPQCKSAATKERIKELQSKGKTKTATKKSA